MTRAIRLTRTGGPEVLELEETTLPELKAGQARVRQLAVGVNFIDTYQRSGLYPIPRPSGLGSDAVGVVDQVGSGVSSVRAGERGAYAGAGAPAAYADAALVAADRLVPVPFQTIRDGLKIEIGQRFPVAEAARAHRALESRTTTCSTLLTL